MITVGRVNQCFASFGVYQLDDPIKQHSQPGLRHSKGELLHVVQHTVLPSSTGSFTNKGALDLHWEGTQPAARAQKRECVCVGGGAHPPS